MPNAKDILSIPAENMNFFVVGSVGSGKSFFATTFPTPAFLFDFDRQVTVYEGLDVDYEQYDFTNLGWLKFEQDLTKIILEKKYKTIIIDSMTSLQAVALERALAINPTRNEAQGAKFEIHFPLMRTLIDGQMRRILSYVGYKVVIAHLEFEKDKEGSIVGCHPYLVGALKTVLPTFFGEILYAQRRYLDNKQTYCLQTVNLGLYNCRSNLSGRTKKLPDFVPNNFNSIMDILKKRKEEDLNKLKTVPNLIVASK